MIQLFDWQVPLRDRILRALETYKCALVATPTGSGKTFLAASASKELKRKPVVICPKSVITPWKNALDAVGTPYYEVLNWESMRVGKGAYFDGKDWALPGDAVLIADEIHKFCSGEQTKSGTMLINAKKTGVPVIMLSATAASTPLQMRHSGYLLGLHNWEKYRAWPLFKLNHGCRFDKFLGHWVPPKGRNLATEMAKINAAAGDRIIYLKVSEIPGFPETVIQPKLYDLETKYTKEIAQAWKEMDDQLKKPGVNELSELIKARRRTELIKLPLIEELLEDGLEQGFSVVVFFNFLDPLHKCADFLREKGVEFSSIYGEQKTDRDEEIRKFQDNEVRVLLATIQAGGVGISLHHPEVPRMSIINVSYSASDFRQAIGRIRRVGGGHTVQLIPLAADTVEERVYRALVSKLTAIDRLNDKDMR